MTEQAKPYRVGKNGYEIRLDILSLANTFLENEHQNSMRWAEAMNLPSSEFPDPPCIEDIIETAELLYQFVNKQSK
jgi:hypothetical protein